MSTYGTGLFKQENIKQQGLGDESKEKIKSYWKIKKKKEKKHRNLYSYVKEFQMYVKPQNINRTRKADTEKKPLPANQANHVKHNVQA